MSNEALDAAVFTAATAIGHGTTGLRAIRACASEQTGALAGSGWRSSGAPDEVSR